MSVIQSTQPELRYVKRQNLDNEARIIGNYYRDLIRSYGVDCIYSKLDTSEFSNFKNIIDRNTLLKQAYGYNISPDYSMSAHTLTYMEIENDIFQLNKFGLNPNADVNFYFENNDFACALATKVGKYKEYPIDETFIECEVPACTDEYEEYDFDVNEVGVPKKHFLSSNIFPYELGLGYKENYFAENLSGKLYVAIEGYEVGKECTIACHPYEHTDFNVKFDSNSDLYKCLKHEIENDDYLETMIFLTFTVRKMTTGEKETLKLDSIMFGNDSGMFSVKNALKKIYKHLAASGKFPDLKYDFEYLYSLDSMKDCITRLQTALGIELYSLNTLDDMKKATLQAAAKAQKIQVLVPKYKYILSGKIHGNVLFYDVNELGKYIEKIHPAVGDIVTIDFPDENNRERYEITDCFDKQLTQDGISPLLHKYIWKCKARRYANTYEDAGYNEADERLQEKLDYDALVKEEVAKKISLYEDGEDAAYGGYELERDSVKNYDKQDVRNIQHVEYEGLPEGHLIDIHKFECGSKLCTDGYALVFVTADDDAYVVTTDDKELTVRDAVFECGVKWLKATKDQIRFVNIEGTSFQLAFNEDAANAEDLNLDSLYDVTVEANNINKTGESFIKFNGCKTYMFATADSLYAKLENNSKTYRLV